MHFINLKFIFFVQARDEENPTSSNFLKRIS